MSRQKRICDYGDSSYRQDFWEGQGRDYEDLVERRLLKRLLPESGARLLEVGAGFGRMSAEYHMVDQVVLLDYSLEQLQYARRKLGDARYVYVAADAYRMPFAADAFDLAIMIRVIHHIEDVPAVLEQVSRCLCQGGRFILEYANKRHLKSALRHLLGRNGWSPYSQEPVEFVELNFNFHPQYMAARVAEARFTQRRAVPVSWCRLPLLKARLPAGLLARVDALLQRSGWLFSPSVFLDLRADAGESDAVIQVGDPLAFLRCPDSGTALRQTGDELVSEAGIRWRVVDGVYDFRQPVD